MFESMFSPSGAGNHHHYIPVPLEQSTHRYLPGLQRVIVEAQHPNGGGFRKINAFTVEAKRGETPSQTEEEINTSAVEIADAYQSELGQAVCFRAKYVRRLEDGEEARSYTRFRIPGAEDDEPKATPMSFGGGSPELLIALFREFFRSYGDREQTLIDYNKELTTLLLSQSEPLLASQQQLGSMLRQSMRIGFEGTLAQARADVASERAAISPVEEDDFKESVLMPSIQIALQQLMERMMGGPAPVEDEEDEDVEGGAENETEAKPGETSTASRARRSSDVKPTGTKVPKTVATVVATPKPASVPTVVAKAKVATTPKPIVKAPIASEIVEDAREPVVSAEVVARASDADVILFSAQALLGSVASDQMTRLRKALSKKQRTLLDAIDKAMRAADAATVAENVRQFQGTLSGLQAVAALSLLTVEQRAMLQHLGAFAQHFGA